MTFPQYRKLKDHPRYYQITDERHFTEVYRIGTKLITHEVNAIQYPEMLRIKDMLENTDLFVEITAHEYDSFVKHLL